MLVTGIPSRAGSEIVVWAWEKLLSIRWVTRGRQRGAQALQGRLRLTQVDQDESLLPTLSQPLSVRTLNPSISSHRIRPTESRLK